MMQSSGREYYIVQKFSRAGSGYLRSSVKKFNMLAQHLPVFLLTDLDDQACPPSLIQNWLPYKKHSNFVFRVAVREVEAWVMADRQAFSKFISVSSAKIPRNLDSVPDPKQLLLNLAHKSTLRRIRDDLVTIRREQILIGRNYNDRLSKFVENDWNPDRASSHSDSLQRAMESLAKFAPLI